MKMKKTLSGKMAAFLCLSGMSALLAAAACLVCRGKKRSCPETAPQEAPSDHK